MSRRARGQSLAGYQVLLTLRLSPQELGELDALAVRLGVERQAVLLGGLRVLSEQAGGRARRLWRRCCALVGAVSSGQDHRAGRE